MECLRDNDSKNPVPVPGAYPGDAVSLRRIGEYHVYQRSDGPDYWQVIEEFKKGLLPVQAIANLKPHLRRLFKITVHGTPMILKWQMHREERTEHLIWQILTGPFHSKLIRKVAAAVDNGCGSVQNMYLVAEKMNGRICEESFALLEFIEGRTLSEACHADGAEPGAGDMEVKYVTKNSSVTLRLDAKTVGGVRAAVMDIHRHRLWLNDLHPSNFLVTEKGIRIIDLLCRSSSLLAPAKDIVRLRNRYGIWLPIGGTTTRLACAYVHFLDDLRDKRRKRRASNPARQS